MKQIDHNTKVQAAMLAAEIECAEDASERIKLGLAVRAAVSADDDLRDAVLRDVALRGAYLSGADLSDGCPIKIEHIHQRVYEAASQEGALDMRSWHADGSCGTTHCRAGWVVHLAGDAGRALEWVMGTPTAAAMIYMASDPQLERIPDFYCTNAEALEDMQRLAEAEAARAAIEGMSQ